MAYSELIKSFARIRDYMSQFYIYGFKTRNEYDLKSSRSYDNERRRIESWLGDFMSFDQDANGKNVFLSVDSRCVAHNPLYNAFKAKSFTDNDIMLHFYILDILSSGEKLSIREIEELICDEYSSFFDEEKELDEATIRKKLKEYASLGILKSEKRGKELVFYRAEDSVDLDSWRDAVAFFSEENPLGVVGSYILDKYDFVPDYYSFKHHYILYAIESEILYDLLLVIDEKQTADIYVYSRKNDVTNVHAVVPLKIYASTQGGRRYVLVYHLGTRGYAFFRLDSIKKVERKEKCEYFDDYLSNVKGFEKYAWGVSTSKNGKTDHIEMTVFVGEKEEYILNRLNREKRNGKIEKVDENHYRFVADVYDSTELIPWLRTFIGRITSLECSNQRTTKIFFDDLEKMSRLYGGDDDAV